MWGLDEAPIRIPKVQATSFCVSIVVHEDIGTVPDQRNCGVVMNSLVFSASVGPMIFTGIDNVFMSVDRDCHGRLLVGGAIETRLRFLAWVRFHAPLYAPHHDS
jgi:hypothetical protein